MLICAFAAHSDLDPRCEISEGRMFAEDKQTEIALWQWRPKIALCNQKPGGSDGLSQEVSAKM
jgi:hypothetical protein